MSLIIAIVVIMHYMYYYARKVWWFNVFTTSRVGALLVATVSIAGSMRKSPENPSNHQKTKFSSNQQLYTPIYPHLPPSTPINPHQPP